MSPDGAQGRPENADGPSAPEVSDDDAPVGQSVDGGDELVGALSEALGRRAAGVRSQPDGTARAAVDRRLVVRSRNRRARRGVLAATVVGAIIAAAALVVPRDPDNADVATEGQAERPSPGDGTDDDGGGTPTDLLPDQVNDDPATFGLPRVILDPEAGLQPQLGPQPVAMTGIDLPPGLGFLQIQAFREPGHLIPVIGAPWSAPGQGGQLPATDDEGRPVSVGGVSGTVHGESGEWLTLEWPLPDGTTGQLYSYGVTQDELVEVAAGLRRPVDPAARGYEATVVPSGYVLTPYIAPVDPVTASSALVFEDPSDSLRVELRVGASHRVRFEERLAQKLADARSAEEIEVMDDTGLLVQDRNDGEWSVSWGMVSNVGAELIITGATRDDVDRVIDALRIATATEWTDTLAAAAPATDTPGHPRIPGVRGLADPARPEARLEGEGNRDKRDPPYAGSHHRPRPQADSLGQKVPPTQHTRDAQSKAAAGADRSERERRQPDEQAEISCPTSDRPTPHQLRATTGSQPRGIHGDKIVTGNDRFQPRERRDEPAEAGNGASSGSTATDGPRSTGGR